MRDLQVNIGGPSGRARQQVNFNVSTGKAAPGLDLPQVAALIAQLRSELAQSGLPADDQRRAERQLATIEDEAKSQSPLLSEISGAANFLGRLFESARDLAPVAASTYQLLANALGLPSGAT